MPKYRITGPDGSTYEVNAPEGATEQDAIAYVQQSHVKATSGPPKKSGLLDAIGQNFTAPIKQAYAGLQDTRAKDKALTEKIAGRSFMENLQSAPQDMAEGVANTVNQGLGAAQLALSPIAGAVNTVAKPVGEAVSNLAYDGGVSAYKSPQRFPFDPEAYGQSPQAMNRDEAAQSMTDNIATALSLGVPEKVGPPRLRSVSASPSKINPDVAILRSRGVDVLPGAAKGGLSRNIEDIAGKLPIVGTAKRAASQRSIESFNKAVLNDALAPIGEVLPADMAAGHTANAHTYDTIQAGYKANQPGRPIILPKDFGDVTQHPDFDILSPESQSLVERVMNNRVLTKAPSGELDGRNFGKAVEILRGDIKRLKKQPGEGELVSGILKDKLDELTGEAAIQDPAYGARKQALDVSYSKVKTAQDASKSVATENGVFTPSHYLGAVKNADSSAGKNLFATGRAFDQDFAIAAKNLLTDRVPNTGGEVGIVGNALMQIPTAIGGVVGGPLGAAGGLAASTGGLYAASRAYEPAAIARLNAGLDRQIAAAAGVNIPRIPKGSPLRLPAPTSLAIGASNLNGALALPPLLSKAAAEPPRKRRHRKRARPS